MNNRIVNVLKYALGWPISLLAFIFIARIIIPQMPIFITNIHQINYVVLIYAFLAFLVYYFVRSYIWYILVQAYSDKVNFRNATYFWGVSELKRYIPGSIISFFGRAVLFSDLEIPKKVTGKLLITEAIILVIGAGAISLLALPFVTNYFIPQINLTLSWLIVLALFFIVLLIIL